MQALCISVIPLLIMHVLEVLQLPCCMWVAAVPWLHERSAMQQHPHAALPLLCDLGWARLTQCGLLATATPMQVTN